MHISSIIDACDIINPIVTTKKSIKNWKFGIGETRRDKKLLNEQNYDGHTSG
jgi:hypothetical protein